VYILKKILLFDFDGTLVDSKYSILEIYNNNIAEKYGYNKLNKEDIEMLMNVSIKERCRILEIPFHKIPGLLLEETKTFRKYIKSIDMIEGIKEILYKLKEKKYSMGILSSNAEENIREFLDYNNIKIFEFIFSSSNLFGKHKTIKKCLKKYDFNKEDVLYVGDEIRDIVSCKKIDMNIAAVTWGFDSKNLLKQESPEFLVDSPEELYNIIESFE
jgi:phosphoglycolate phosphatase